MTNFYCLAPCTAEFPNRTRLVQHYKSIPDCKTRWDRHVADLAHARSTLANPSSLQRHEAPREPQTIPVMDAYPLPDAGGDEAQGFYQDYEDNSSDDDSSDDDAHICPQMDPSLLDTVEEFYPRAGRVHANREPPFELLAAEATSAGSGNIYYPFQSFDEWCLARWFHETGVSMAQTDAFFRIPCVSSLSLFRKSAQVKCFVIDTRLESLLQERRYASRTIRAFTSHTYALG
jgi:hypothetical protein